MSHEPGVSPMTPLVRSGCSREPPQGPEKLGVPFSYGFKPLGRRTRSLTDERPGRYGEADAYSSHEPFDPTNHTHSTDPSRMVEKGRQPGTRCSCYATGDRIAQRLNVPAKGYPFASSLAAAALDDLFEHPVTRFLVVLDFLRL